MSEIKREPLTRREREVAEFVCSTHLTNKEIAHILFIHETTVKMHLHNIYKKLGVATGKSAHSREALVRLFARRMSDGSADISAESSR